MKPEEKRQNHLAKLKQRLKVAKKVDKAVKTEGYKEIIQPLIDKMIQDIDAQVTSHKKGNIWIQGYKATPKEQQEAEYYRRLFYYKQALIDLNNRIQAYPEAIDNLKKEVNKLESGRWKEEQKSPYKYWGNDG